MKTFIALLLLTTFARAESSRLIPAFLEAAELYPSDETFVHSPTVRAVLQVLHAKKIPAEYLSGLQGLDRSEWPLPADDRYDAWVRSASETKELAPELSLHAVKIDVKKASDYRDDIYAYFFITDGVIPTGKVSSIYKATGSGQGFFFNQVDRAIFPLIGIPAKSPSNHLIVDYGIVESDGDDVKRLQALSDIIIDIAITVYASQDPTGGQILINLRKEVKALAGLLISFNTDDRLVTDSFGYTAAQLAELLKDQTFVEIPRSHKGQDRWTSWDYTIHFRLLR